MLRKFLKLNRTTVLPDKLIAPHRYITPNTQSIQILLQRQTTNFFHQFSSKVLVVPELDFGEFVPMLNRKKVDFYVRERYAVIFNLLKDGTKKTLSEEDVGELADLHLRQFNAMLIEVNEKQPHIPTHRIFIPILRYFVDHPFFKGHWMRYYLAVALNKHASTEEERDELMALLNEFDAIDFYEGRHLLAQVQYEGRHVEQDFAHALALLEINVRTSIVPSMLLLAIMLRDGNGVTSSPIRAAEIFISCGYKGNADGYLAMADLHQRGMGVKKSEEEALRYFTLAAGLQSKIGTHNVGCAYFMGKGCVHSYKKALRYFKEAGELGHPLSMINAGNMYFNGYGTAVDLMEARKWYVRAAELKLEALDLIKIVDAKLEESETKSKKS